MGKILGCTKVFTSPKHFRAPVGDYSFAHRGCKNYVLGRLLYFTSYVALIDECLILDPGFMEQGIQ
jgi:hypothetical protein